MAALNYTELYDEFYFNHYGDEPYTRARFLPFFATLAERIVSAVGPVSVLDAGCSLGLLVESLRDRGVEAFGVDVSPYAIDQIREDIKPYCRVASITDPLPRRYDLIVCIEVLEHMPRAEGVRAIENLCASSDDIIISSSPDLYHDATHINVQPPEYWTGIFAQVGFWHDVEFDASFITPWAMRFRKGHDAPHRVVQAYERKLWLLSKQVTALRSVVVETRAQMAERHQNAQPATQDRALQPPSPPVGGTEGIAPPVPPSERAAPAFAVTPLHSDDAMPQLPYQETLDAAAATGQVLHRDQIYGSGPPTGIASPEAVSLIAAHCQSPVLDFGCGVGAYVAALQERGFSATGLEVNAEYAAQARSLGREVRLYDGDAVPFADGSFDTVMAIEVLEHIPDWERSLREMLRVARRCVLISVPNIGVLPALSRHLVVPWHILEATHLNFFSREILANYLSDMPGITSQVSTYGPFPINGEIYHNHVFAVIHKDVR